MDEFHSRNCFDNKLVIFMPVVVKGYIFTIIFIDTRSGYNRSSKIAVNVFGNNFRIAFVWFCINIKSFFVIAIAFCLNSFEGRTESLLHKIEESGTKCIAQIGVVKVSFASP